MKKHLRVIASILAAALLFTGCAGTAGGGNSNSNAAKAPASNGNLTIADNAVDFAANLKFGWNLGNTLEANAKKGLESETSWGQPKATKELIDYIKASGFTSIRIPVSWGNHMDENYNIDEEWMNRVTEVVDWALDDGLYVIINTHHDDEYFYPSAEHLNDSIAYLTAIWTQIANHFENYDERLIFEGMNEPRLKGTAIEWWFAASNQEGCKAISTIAMLNQVFVDAVRACGGYNQTRYLMIQSYAASPSFTMHGSYSIANDPSNRLLLSIHAYTPYDFAMNANGYKNWDGSHRNELTFIDSLNDWFISKGIGVVITEFGATNKGNLEDRVAWAKAYTSRAESYGISCFLWDNGGTQIGEENFGMIDRRNLNIFFPELLDAYMEAYK